MHIENYVYVLNFYQASYFWDSDQWNHRTLELSRQSCDVYVKLYSRTTILPIGQCLKRMTLDKIRHRSIIFDIEYIKKATELYFEISNKSFKIIEKKALVLQLLPHKLWVTTLLVTWCSSQYSARDEKSTVWAFWKYFPKVRYFWTTQVHFLDKLVRYLEKSLRSALDEVFGCPFLMFLYS